MNGSMNASIRRAFGWLGCGIGLHHLFRWLNRRRVLIIAYHGVVDGPLPAGCPEWHHVEKTGFERQIDFLTRHYRIVTIDDAVAMLDDPPSPIACITFDDGYLNNRSAALPVLAARMVPATVYLATGLVGTDRRLWTVRLEAAIRNTDITEIDLTPVGLGIARLEGDTPRTTLAGRINLRLKSMLPADRDRIVTTLIERLGEPPDDVLEPFRMLAWTDVLEMERHAISFGAHTVNHEIVSTLDGDALENEVAGSIRTVASRVDHASRTFAFPNGRPEDLSTDAKQLLEDLGVSAALSTIEGLNDGTTDRYELRRIVVGRNMDFDTFRLATAGVIESVKRLLRRTDDDAP